MAGSRQQIKINLVMALTLNKANRLERSQRNAPKYVGIPPVGNHARRSAWPTFTLADIQKPK
jgi:hypothetical protein